MNEELKKIIEYPQKGILSKEILKNDKVDVTLFCLSKKTEISNHASTKSGFVYVIEGGGIFNLKGKDILMSDGVFIYMNENDIHSIKAEVNTSFILTLINN